MWDIRWFFQVTSKKISSNFSYFLDYLTRCVKCSDDIANNELELLEQSDWDLHCCLDMSAQIFSENVSPIGPVKQTFLSYFLAISLNICFGYL